MAIYSQFLSRSLEQVDDEEWLMEVGNIMGDKETVLSRYSAFPEEKSFLYKCIGVLMRKSTHKQFVQKHLDMLFSTVKHSSQAEREVSWLFGWFEMCFPLALGFFVWSGMCFPPIGFPPIGLRHWHWFFFGGPDCVSPP